MKVFGLECPYCEKAAFYCREGFMPVVGETAHGRDYFQIKNGERVVPIDGENIVCQLCNEELKCGLVLPIERIKEYELNGPDHDQSG